MSFGEMFGDLGKVDPEARATSRRIARLVGGVTVLATRKILADMVQLLKQGQPMSEVMKVLKEMDERQSDFAVKIYKLTREQLRKELRTTGTMPPKHVEDAMVHFGVTSGIKNVREFMLTFKRMTYPHLTKLPMSTAR